MNIIKIQLEFLHGAIWCCDENGILYLEPIEIVKNDEKCRELDKKTESIYSSYYEFNLHDQLCWFNEEQKYKDRFIMLDLLEKLVSRLNEINDGSYVVEPIALEYYRKLCEK